MVANYVAKWDGTAWSSLGTGTANGVANGSTPLSIVYALAVSGSTLYAGGEFTTAGGVAANFLARWNGLVWSSLGNQAATQSIYSVQALAVSGNTLYAGGNNVNASGTGSRYVAAWDGTAWSSLGTDPDSGVNGTVYALAPSSSGLYTGGGFNVAGDVGANGVAVYTPAVLLPDAPAEASELTLFPNPTQGLALLVGAEAGAPIRAFNLQGQQVAATTADADGAAMLPAVLAPGFYLVRTGTHTLRLVVE